MEKTEALKAEIEKERKKLDEMLETMTAEETLWQSRRLDGLLEQYISLPQENRSGSSLSERMV